METTVGKGKGPLTPRISIQVEANMLLLSTSQHKMVCKVPLRRSNATPKGASQFQGGKRHILLVKVNHLKSQLLKMVTTCR